MEHGVDDIMPKLSVRLGDGFEFDDNNAITSAWEQSEIDGKIIKQPDGLYIPSLKGKDGSGGGTKVDNHTLIEEDKGVVINPAVVQVIYTMSVWQTLNDGRYQGHIPYATQNGRRVIKTKNNVLNEINFLFDRNQSYTSYAIKKNDLFQLVTGGDNDIGGYPYTFTYNGITMEDGNRYVTQTTVALFVVESIAYRDDNDKRAIADISLKCLWSADGYYSKDQSLS